MLDGDVLDQHGGMVWKSIMNGIGPTCSVVIDKHGWLVLDQRVLWSKNHMLDGPGTAC